MSTYKYLWDSVLADVLIRAGFTGNGYMTAFGVILGESAGDPYSTNWNGEGQPVTFEAGEPLPDRATPVTDTYVTSGGVRVLVKAGQTVPADAVTITAGVFIPRPARPAVGWFEGGESHDIGLCQWSDYWHLANPDSALFGDPASRFYCPDRATALRKAYNPIWSVDALFAFTERGSKNWSTWNAYTNGTYAADEFSERATRALEKVVAGVSTAHSHTVGGARALRASSIPARCNPPISWSRFSRLNQIVTIRRKVDGQVIREKVPMTPDLMLPPGTDIGVNYTTTRIAAGPIPGTLT